MLTAADGPVTPGNQGKRYPFDTRTLVPAMHGDDTFGSPRGGLWTGEDPAKVLLPTAVEIGGERRAGADLGR